MYVYFAIALVTVRLYACMLLKLKIFRISHVNLLTHHLHFADISIINIKKQEYFDD